MTKNIDPKAKKTLTKIANKLKASNKYQPVHDDPIDELRLLVTEHKNLTKKLSALTNWTTDKKLDDGTVLKCPFPEDIVADLKATKKPLERRKKQLERRMAHKHNLGSLPLWTLFLKHVFGCGPVMASYLAVYVQFDRCAKPSNLIRRCGNANHTLADGRRTLEKPGQGTTKEERIIKWRPELRVTLHQMFSAMIKNAGKLHCTGKYLQVSDNYKQRMQHSPRRWKTFIDLDHKECKAANALRAGTAEKHNRPSKKGGIIISVEDKATGKRIGELRSAGKFINDAARRKATDVFLEDVYMMGRAIEGLPVWPSWYADRLGYRHGGKIKVDGPVLLTVEQVLELIGYVGQIPLRVDEAA